MFGADTIVSAAITGMFTPNTIVSAANTGVFTPNTIVSAAITGVFSPNTIVYAAITSASRMRLPAEFQAPARSGEDQMIPNPFRIHHQ